MYSYSLEFVIRLSLYHSYQYFTIYALSWLWSNVWMNFSSPRLHRSWTPRIPRRAILVPQPKPSRTHWQWRPLVPGGSLFSWVPRAAFGRPACYGNDHESGWTHWSVLGPVCDCAAREGRWGSGRRLPRRSSHSSLRVLRWCSRFDSVCVRSNRYSALIYCSATWMNNR